MATTEKRSEADAIQVESTGTDNGLDHLKNVDLHDKTLANQAYEGTTQEHNSGGVWKALMLHRRAAFWSICEFRSWFRSSVRVS
jgi:MFS transporter, SP family, general alpha glucoside:H+ symporter